jgi:hypothetical protein
MHGTLQQPQVNIAQAANSNRERHALRYSGYGRVVKEKRQQRTRAGKRESQYRTDTRINPKEIAHERFRELLALHDQFRESIQTEAAKQEAKGRHHGHNSEIRRSQQPCQDDYGPDLHGEVARRTSNGRPGATNCGPAKSPAGSDRVEGAIGLKGLQRLSF